MLEALLTNWKCSAPASPSPKVPVLLRGSSFFGRGVKEICSRGSCSLGKVHTVQTELQLHLNSCLPEKVRMSHIPKNRAAELSCYFLFPASLIIPYGA